MRSEDFELPLYLRQMLIDIDEQADEIFARIEKLPLVLCHRDFWVTNLIYADGNFALIDWDTSGWGYLGEDLASLIADEPDINHMVEHYQRCIPTYYKGFSEYAAVSRIADHCVYEIILLVFGYRLVEGYLHTETDDEKTKHVHTLQKINEMKTIPLLVTSGNIA
ncbi:phosphotransferase family protein [Paenibacillus alba]|uniref:phosphotransferase family protein n=1 Tax=Paenibacillus alba TaxID=1197127 RepID=UPI00398A6AE2